MPAITTKPPLYGRMLQWLAALIPGEGVAEATIVNNNREEL